MAGEQLHEFYKNVPSMNRGGLDKGAQAHGAGMLNTWDSWA